MISFLRCIIFEPISYSEFILVTLFDWWEIQFDQVWSILDRSDPKNQKQNSHFYPFCKCDNFL